MYLDLSLYFHGNPWERRDTYPDFSVFASKVPGVWQRCFGAVLWEIYSGQPRNSLGRPWERACADKLGGAILALPLLHYLANVAAQSGDSCSARLNLCHMRRRMENCACPVCPRESQQLSQSPICLLTLWVPSLPSLSEEGAFRVGASLLHSLTIE